MVSFIALFIQLEKCYFSHLQTAKTSWLKQPDGYGFNSFEMKRRLLPAQPTRKVAKEVSRNQKESARCLI